MHNTFLNEIDKSNYVVEADIENFGTKWKLTNIFDGATSSAWQSETATRPVTIKVDLGGKHIIRAINISPMLSAGFIGYWEQFDILTSSDGKNYKELIKDYSFPKRDLSEKTITLDEPVQTRYIAFRVKKYTIYIEKAGQTIRYTMTAPPKIKNGRTYIPVRFVSEHLGYNVGWDGETKTITIN